MGAMQLIENQVSCQSLAGHHRLSLSVLQLASLLGERAVAWVIA